MRVQLLGTGSADGWPNPWCSCPSCTWARADPARVRGHTAALVDDVLLVDCGPDVPRTAQRHGVSFAGLRTLLLTHAHPDHTGPAALLWRQWADAGPLEVAGPPPALAACQEWAGPDAHITWTPLRAGDEIRSASGHAIRAMAARHGSDGSGPALLYAVDDLLIGWDTAAPLPAEVHRHGPYATALLECTHGLRPGPGEHHTLDDLEATVAGLREAGTLTDTSRVVAVHLGHHNPPGPALAERLATFGVEVHPDGALLGPRRVLVTGGARSGKSHFAESLLAAHASVTYVATGASRDDDPEWTERVARHRRRRPAHWRTVETLDVGPHLASPAVLVDCLTLWLSRSMFTEDGARLEAPADGLLETLRSATGTVVLVTNEVGSGIVPATASGRAFSDALGELNTSVAAACDEVWLCVAGGPDAPALSGGPRIGVRETRSVGSVRHVEHVWDTVISLHLEGSGNAAAARDAIVAWVHHVDDVLSPFKPGSDLSRWQRGELDLGGADPMLPEVLELAMEAADLTDGGFDLRWSPIGPDPTGLVKGWAVDRAVALAVGHGMADVQINAGGDVRVAGQRPGGGPWRIGIEDPADPQQVLAVVGGPAVATSGTWQRGQHIRLREGAEALLGVSVVGPSLGLADGISTGAMALGAEALRMLTALDPRWRSLVVRADGTVWTSPSWIGSA